MDRRAALVALAGALPFARTALAQTGPIGPDQYRLMALMGGDFAIRTSQLALQRGQSAGLRQFAQLEINEQTSIAASLSGAPGTVPLRPDQAAMIQQLAALPAGPRFDAMYVRGQIMGHRELLGLNTNYLQSGFRDAVSTAVANVAVPSIQTHLTILARLQRGGAVA
jgi:putative membrane protein